MEHKTNNTVDTTDFHEEITLARLEDLDNYKVDDDYENVKGWKVQANQGFNIGTVRGLIASKELKRVLYLDVSVDRSHCNNDDSKLYILIPIGLTVFDEDSETVKIDSIDAEAFVTYPRYDGSDIKMDYEYLLNGYYAKHPNVELQPYIGRTKKYYDHEMLYDKEMMYGNETIGF